jgi:hypothetical protein
VLLGKTEKIFQAGPEVKNGMTEIKCRRDPVRELRWERAWLLWDLTKKEGLCGGGELE